MYIIKYIFYKPDFKSITDIVVASANLSYFLYFIVIYINYLSNEKLMTTIEHGHLKWPWIKYATPEFYLVLFAINIFYLFNLKYALFLFMITYFFLYLNRKYFYYNTGELWCFFGTFIPLIMYLIF